MYIKRANYVVKILNSAGTAMLNLPLRSDHGWHHDCNITWVQEQFPDDVSFLLLNDENEEMVFGNLMTMKMNKVKSKGQRLRKALLPIIYYFYIL